MRPTLMPRRQTLSNGSPAKPAATTSTGQTAVPKFAACFQAILKGSEKPAPYTVEDPERFYFDLFCLNVDNAYLRNLANEVPDAQLVDSGPVKNNVRELFFYAVRCIRTSDVDDIRLPNVIEILHGTLTSFLSRALPNYSYDVMSLLAGSLDQADVVFPDFVTAIDGLLQSTDCPVALKERTMALALLVVTSINQGSVNSYFLRRDLFSSVIKLVADPSTAHLAADSFLMLGVLANYHKYKARNAMLVRFEDLVDEGIMRRVREAASTSLEQARDAYVQQSDDSPATLASNVASLLSSFRFLASPSRTPSSNGTTSAKEDSAFADQPLELVAILLPIYDLVNSNKAFSSFLLNDKPSQESPEPEFVATLTSVTSYLATHASISPRSRVYSRLSFIILSILVEEGSQLLTSSDQNCAIRICRQKQPSLPPSSDKPRPPICGILDSIVQHLRFNITRKKFDVATYLLVLRLVHKIMHQLKTSRTRIDYNWEPILQAIMNLAHYLVARQAELADLAGMEDLISQVLLTLDFAVVWADVILPDVDAIAQLLYEILRADATLSKLGALTSTASTPPVIAPPSPRLGTTSPTARRTSGSGFNTPRSPGIGTPPSFASAMASLEPRGPAAESIRNLSVVRSHFGGKVEDFREKSGSAGLDSSQILGIIKTSMDGLDLRESMALEEVGMRRYSESEHEAFFSELVPIVAKDILRLSSA